MILDKYLFMKFMNLFEINNWNIKLKILEDIVLYINKYFNF